MYKSRNKICWKLTQFPINKILLFRLLSILIIWSLMGKLKWWNSVFEKITFPSISLEKWVSCKWKHDLAIRTWFLLFNTNPNISTAFYSGNKSLIFYYFIITSNQNTKINLQNSLQIICITEHFFQKGSPGFKYCVIIFHVISAFVGAEQ